MINPPVKRFRSPGGRHFVVRAGEHVEHRPFWHDVFPIYMQGRRVGTLWRDENYGKTADGHPRWTATTREVCWSGPLPPLGLGFDVAAFDTARDALDAWARSVDQVLDWREGKRVRSIYSKTGFYQREVAT
jgi:hypothetical protein